jgi:radical SAM superfamily enzyme
METTYLYTDFSHFLKKFFDFKVQKISVNAGFTCPNRDGKIGYGGCIFCSAEGSGEFAEKQGKSISEQLENAKKRVERKIKDGKYIAYFQSFSYICSYV